MLGLLDCTCGDAGGPDRPRGDRRKPQRRGTERYGQVRRGNKIDNDDGDDEEEEANLGVQLNPPGGRSPKPLRAARVPNDTPSNSFWDALAGGVGSAREQFQVMTCTVNAR